MPATANKTVSIDVPVSDLRFLDEPILGPAIINRVAAFGAADVYAQHPLIDWFLSLSSDAQETFFELELPPAAPKKALLPKKSPPKKAPAKKKPLAKSNGPIVTAAKMPRAKRGGVGAADLHRKLIEALKARPEGVSALGLQHDLNASAGQVKGLLKRAIDTGDVRATGQRGNKVYTLALHGEG
jgi:hypothetical protein